MEPINLQTPLAENWLRIVTATRLKRPHEIVRLSGGCITLDRAQAAIRRYHANERERKRQERAALPFTSYPGSGRVLLGRVRGSNCRHEYGLMFLGQTGQRDCAYCGLPLTRWYRNWLQMSLDHVVPVVAGTAKGIPVSWLEDSSNKVLACAACNTFQNRYALDEKWLCPETLGEFFALRDRVFVERREKVMACHAQEREFFESRPWANRA